MSRMGVVYRNQSRSILDNISDVLTESKIPVEVDPGRLKAVIKTPRQVNIGFRTRRQMMGATINTVYQWTFESSLNESRNASTMPDKAFSFYLSQAGTLRKRKSVFKCKKQLYDVYKILFDRLNLLEDLDRLDKDSGIKSLVVQWTVTSAKVTVQVEMVPIAGVISVVYFPPVAPHMINLTSKEIKSQYELLMVLCDEVTRFFADIDSPATLKTGTDGC